MLRGWLKPGTPTESSLYGNFRADGIYCYMGSLILLPGHVPCQTGKIEIRLVKEAQLRRVD